ncbi:MAG: hypothetical protein JWR19_3393 [Pedosphaera sp.]|nr:hypothetical protein [Pedosphaera sp.]
MRTENLLPKFGSAKNPFGTTSTPSTTPVPEVKKKEPVKAPEITPELPKVEPAKPVTHSLFDPQQAFASLRVAPAAIVKAVAPLPMEPVIAEPARVEPPVAREVPVPARKRLPLATWAKKLNPLAYLPARKASAQPVRTRVARTPVQTELSLERVKVIRNDLTEADLEVIQARPVPAVKLPQSAPPAPSAPQAGPVSAEEPTAWGRLTSRFFGAEQTQIR